MSDEVLAAILERLDRDPPSRSFVNGVAGRPIRLPAGTPAGPAQIAREDGTEAPAVIGADGQLSPVHAIGYHRLVAGGTEIDLAIAPPRCPPMPPGRSWGVAVQVPALRGAADRAFGDFGALADAARAFGQAGADALAISPTHALFPADPSRYSPYAPSSRLFHNVLFADPALVNDGLRSEPSPALIDWKQAIPARLAQLRAAFASLSEPARAAVQAFRRERGELLETHARFDALHGIFFATSGALGWQDWPDRFHDPHGPAVAQFAAEQPDEVAFFAFLQWLAELGLADAQATARQRMRVGLIADLAVGMDAGGSHGWGRRTELLSGLSVGAPPDPLGPQGQNWGITALDPFALARNAFTPWIETLRAALRHAGGIRIDHALGLQRLWVIPAGGSADQGAYLAMPNEAMLHILAIEAHRAGAVVIGEDLGTVPPGFRARMAQQGLLGMRVLPFERDEAGAFKPPADWDPFGVAMTGTHDTPTLAGWWRGRDLEWAARLGHGRPGAMAEREQDRRRLWQALSLAGEPSDEPPIDALLAHTSSAPCPLAIVPLEDLVGLEEQPNLPGTVDEHPNWRRRMPDATAALLRSPVVARRAAQLTSDRPGQDMQ